MQIFKNIMINIFSGSKNRFSLILFCLFMHPVPIKVFGGSTSPQACVDMFMSSLQDGDAKQTLENCLTEGRTGFLWNMIGFHSESHKRIQEAKDFVPKNDKKTLNVLKELKDNTVWRKNLQSDAQTFATSVAVVSSLTLLFMFTLDKLVATNESLKQNNIDLTNKIDNLSTQYKTLVRDYNNLNKNFTNLNSDVKVLSAKNTEFEQKLEQNKFDRLDKELKMTKEKLVLFEKALIDVVPQEIERFYFQVHNNISNIKADISNIRLNSLEGFSYITPKLMEFETKINNLDLKQNQTSIKLNSMENNVNTVLTNLKDENDELEHKIIDIENILRKSPIETNK
jgi:hypothetical protein